MEKISPDIQMVTIPAGKFLMGSPEEEKGRDFDEGPQHEVAIQYDFMMSRYPITQGQWKAIAQLPEVSIPIDPDPSDFKGENRPVEQVTWHQTQEFCARLSRYSEQPFRLPSEAEWEYCCRAGTTTPYSFGESLEGMGCYQRDYSEGTSPVGQYPPNAFGLYGMHGNVWEWCQDHWHHNYRAAPNDGSAWMSDDELATRVVRGGAWNYNPRFCRSAYRDDNYPAYRNNNLGFRVVCSRPEASTIQL